MPYELKLRIKYATFTTINGSTSHSHVEILYNDKLIDRTQSAPPEWDFRMSIKLIRVDPNATVTFWVFSKQVVNVGKAISSLATVVGGGGGSGSSLGKQQQQVINSTRHDRDYWFRGEVTTTISALLSSIKSGSNSGDIALSMTLPGSKGSGSKSADLVVGVELVSNLLCSIQRRPRKIFVEAEFQAQLQFRLGDRLFTRIMAKYRLNNHRSFFAEAVNHLLECDSSMTATLIEYLMNEYEHASSRTQHAASVPNRVYPHSAPDYRQLFLLVPFSSLASHIKNEIPAIQQTITERNVERTLTANISSSAIFGSAHRCSLFPKFYTANKDGFCVDVFHYPNGIFACYHLVWSRFMDYLDFLKHIARISTHNMRTSTAFESTARLSCQELRIAEQSVIISTDAIAEAVYLTSAHSGRGLQLLNITFPFHEILLKANHLHHRLDKRHLQLSHITLSAFCLDQSTAKKGMLTLTHMDGGVALPLASGHIRKTENNAAMTVEFFSDVTDSASSAVHVFVEKDQSKASVSLKLTLVNSKDVLLTNSVVTLPLHDIFTATAQTESIYDVDFGAQVNIPVRVSNAPIRISILRMRNLVPVDFGDTSDPYFKVNLADQNGVVINPNTEIYKSRVIEKELNPEWSLHVDIDLERHASRLSTTIYVVIEIYDKNKLRYDVSLGEVYIPLQWFARDEIMFRTLTLPIQPSKATKVPRKESVSFGTIDVILRRFEPNVLSPVKEMVNVKFTAKVEKLTATSCKWPTLCFSGQQQGECLIEDPFSAFVAFNGLLLESIVPIVIGVSSPFVVVLSECQENQGADPSHHPSQATVAQQQQGGGGLKIGVNTLMTKFSRQVMNFDSSSTAQQQGVSLLIPFDQISKEDILIIGEATLIIRFSLKRIIKGATFAQFQTKELNVECMIGPCPAESLAALIIAGIEAVKIKQAVTDCTASLSKTMSVHDLNSVSMMLYEGFNTCMTEFRMSKVMLQSLLQRSHEEGDNELKPAKGEEEEERDHLLFKLLSPITGKRMSFTALQIRCTRIYFCFNVLMNFAAECTTFVDEDKVEVTSAPEYTTHALQQLVQEVETGLQSLIINNDDDSSNSGSVVKARNEGLQLNEFAQFMDNLLLTFTSKIRFMFVYFNQQKREGSEHEELELLNKWVYAVYLPIISFLHDCLAYDDQNGIASSEVDIHQHSHNQQRSGPLGLFTGIGRGITGLVSNENSPTKQSQQVQQQPSQQQPSGRDLALRKDLILFIISEDTIFEEYFQPILDAHGLYFNKPCILSKCVEFDTLLDQFARYVDDNIRGWNTKTVENLMTTVSQQQQQVSNGIFPWEITTLQHAQCATMIISNVPEDIQMQLNIHIGLKKIPARNDRYSVDNIRRVFNLNKKIAAAVGKAYETIALYYSQVLDDVIEKQMKEREITGSDVHVLSAIVNTVGSVGNLGVNVIMFGGHALKSVILHPRHAVRAAFLDDSNDAELAQQLQQQAQLQQAHILQAQQAQGSSENDLLFFIISIINDGDRFQTQRIPEAMTSFLNEYLDDDEADRIIIHGERGVREQFEESFARANKATNQLITEAINALSNEVLFSTEVEPVFVDAIEKVLAVAVANTAEESGNLVDILSLPFEIPKLIAGAIIRQRKEDKEKLLETFDSSSHTADDAPATSTVADSDDDDDDDTATTSKPAAAAAEVKPKKKASIDEEDFNNISPIEVLLATLRDFYQFSGNYTTPSLQSRIVQMCVAKLIARYLIMLRDTLYREAAMAAAATGGIHAVGALGMNLLSPVLAVPVAIGGGVVTVGKAVATALGRGSISMTNANITTAASNLTEDDNELDHSILNPAQIAVIRRDMKSIVNAQRNFDMLQGDDTIMDLLGFFCKAMTDICLENCDAIGLEQRLWIRFRARCPAYNVHEVNNDPIQYKQALQRFLKQAFVLRGRTRDEINRLHETAALSASQVLQVELSDFAVYHMPFGRLALVRASLGLHTAETKIIMPTFTSSNNDNLITWDLSSLKLTTASHDDKDQALVIKLLDVRPLRTFTLATLKLSLDEVQSIVGYEQRKGESTSTIWLLMTEGKVHSEGKVVPSDVLRKDIAGPQIRMTVKLTEKTK